MNLPDMNCSSEKKDVNSKKKKENTKKIHLLKAQRGEDTLAKREKIDKGILTS